MHPQSDRNLLFGVLAVQMNFVNRDDFVAGIQSWVSDKDKSLGDTTILGYLVQARKH